MFQVHAVILRFFFSEFCVCQGCRPDICALRFVGGSAVLGSVVLGSVVLRFYGSSLMVFVYFVFWALGYHSAQPQRNAVWVIYGFVNGFRQV